MADFMPYYKRTAAAYDSTNLSNPPDEFPDFDLRTLLHLSPNGPKVLNFYREKQILSDSCRNKLVDVIGIHIYPYVLKHRLTADQYNLICGKILDLFPNETSSDYYRYGPGVNSLVPRTSGKLVSKVSNMLSKCPDRYYVRKRKQNDCSVTDQKKLRTEEDINAIAWLRDHREPWDDVKSKWDQTFHIRQNRHHEKISEVVNEWPILNDPRARSLIENDFTKLYPDKNSLALFQYWDTFFNNALKLKDMAAIRDPILQNIFEELKATDLAQDSKVALQLCALPRLFPPRGRTKVAKGHWKFSTVEAVDGIIIHATSPEDIDIKINEQKEKAFKRKMDMEVQPYLLVEGPDLKSIRNTYVIIDKVKWQIQTGTLAGLDILFKTFFALNVEYPKQCKSYYHAIQKKIFGIDIPSESFTGNGADLMRIKL